MILHNYVHVFQACDRVNLLRDGQRVIVLTRDALDRISEVYA